MIPPRNRRRKGNPSPLYSVGFVLVIVDSTKMEFRVSCTWTEPGLGATISMSYGYVWILSEIKIKIRDNGTPRGLHHAGQ